MRRIGIVTIIYILSMILSISPVPDLSIHASGVPDKSPVFNEGLSPPNITVEISRYYINSTFYPPIDPAEEPIEGKITCDIPARAKPNVRCMITIYPRLATDQSFSIDPLYFTKNESVKTFSFVIESQVYWGGNTVRYMNFDMNWYYEGARGTGPVYADPIRIEVLPVVVIDVEEKTESPHPVEAGDAKVLPLEIINLGNANGEITLELQDCDEELDVEFHDNNIVFEPKVSKDIYLGIETDEKTPSGTYSFRVLASSDSYGNNTMDQQEILIDLEGKEEKDLVLPIVSGVAVSLLLAVILILLLIKKLK